MTTIAWVRNWTERWLGQPWFSRADVILASSGTTAEPDRGGDRPADPSLSAGHESGALRPTAARSRAGGRLRLHRQPLGQGPRHPGRASRPARASASTSTARAGRRSPTVAAARSRAGALRGPAGDLLLGEAGAGRHLGPDPPLRGGQQPGLRRPRGRHAGGHQLRVRRPRAVRRGLPGLDLAGRACASSSTRCSATTSAATALARRFRSEVLRHHTYAHRARRLTEMLEEHEQKLSFCLKIGAADWEQAERWGDLHFARAVQRDLRGRGHRCLIQVLDEWEDVEGLSLRRRARDPRPEPPPPEAGAVQRALEHQPSRRRDRRGVRRLRPGVRRLGAVRRGARGAHETPVDRARAGDRPERLLSRPSPEYEHDLVYVANSRNVLRPIVRDLLPTDLDLAVYGGNWEGLIDDRYVLGRVHPQRRAPQGLLVGQDRPLRSLGRHARARLHLQPDLRRARLRGDDRLRRRPGAPREVLQPGSHLQDGQGATRVSRSHPRRREESFQVPGARRECVCRPRHGPRREGQAGRRR